MRLFQRKYIIATNPWEPHFFGFFFERFSVPYFAYKTWENSIFLLPLDSDLPIVVPVNFSGGDPTLPSKWIFGEHNDRPYLILKHDVVVDLLQGVQLSDIPEPLLTKHRSCIQNPFFYSLLDYEFMSGDYCISRRGEFGYRCSKAGKIIWEFTGRAYLYTDFTRWNNRIFFGTAGCGGYFYVLDIDTGEVIVSIKTGGTASFAQHDHLCYIASNNSNRNRSKLLCVDLHDGSIIQELDLYGGATAYSRLQKIGPYIHVVTFECKNKQLQNAIWNTVLI